MKKRKAFITSIYLIVICMIGRLSSNHIIVDTKQINSLAQINSLNRNIGIPWDKLSDKEKAGYYERILLNILGPYIRNQIKNYYGEARQYWNDKILYIKPLMYAHEIKVQVETFVGPHNPPYGIDTITLLLKNGEITVTDFQHLDE